MIKESSGLLEEKENLENKYVESLMKDGFIRWKFTNNILKIAETYEGDEKIIKSLELF
jgi:hypothetical protein